MRRAFDAFLYNGEQDVLDLRIKELNSLIDEFWIIESDRTFTGMTKNVYFEKEQKTHRWPISKMRYLLFTPRGDSISNDPWVNERAQREQLRRFVNVCNPEDLILFSDVDEIPRADAVMAALYHHSPQMFGFKFSTYYLKLNFQMIEPSTLANSVGTIGFHKNDLENYTVDQLRMGIKDGSIEASIFENAGWHFSYLMNTQGIKKKIRSFSHQEFNNQEFLSKIKIRKTLKKRTDLLCREGFTFDYAPINTLPKVVRDNPERFKKHLFKSKMVFNKLRKFFC